WHKYMEILEKELLENGVKNISKDFFEYERWYTSDEKNDQQWTLTIEGKSIDVASYWAYSGLTEEIGAEGKLLYLSPDTKKDLMRGKIVVFDVGGLPETFKRFSQISKPEYATKDLLQIQDNNSTGDYWYQVNYLTRFAKLDEYFKDSGALGAIAILSMSPGRAEGIYTFPLIRPGIIGVPGLYVDRVSGNRLRDAALKGKHANLKLLANVQNSKAYFLSGFLPGKHFGEDKDQFILLTTHTDGPNLTQDNGGFGIIKIIEQLNKIPVSERNKTILIMLDPQHFMPGRHSIDWFNLHTNLSSKIVSVVGIEHLGQMEYNDIGNQFRLSGMTDKTYIYSQDNQNMIDQAIYSVEKHKIERTYVLCPDRGGQGPWTGMGNLAQKMKIPGYGISTSMSGYWSTKSGIESFSSELFMKQVDIMTDLTVYLMNANVEEIKIKGL
ncbi:MAG: hypothetical protein MK218_07765, partial [Gammaproteobacteria bacterium]|nr:hypothetical protein [Gammaproteobacteria bacterium]